MQSPPNLTEKEITDFCHAGRFRIRLLANCIILLIAYSSLPVFLLVYFAFFAHENLLHNHPLSLFSLFQSEGFYFAVFVP